MTPSPANVVEIDGVTKSFRTGVTALQDIVLDIRAGEFVSLIGPSGCGKSTLLRIIGDLIQPTSGSIVVNGKTAHQAPSCPQTSSNQEQHQKKPGATPPGAPRSPRCSPPPWSSRRSTCTPCGG